MNELKNFSKHLKQDAPLVDETLYLDMGRCVCSVQSNSFFVLGVLKDYFSQVVCDRTSPEFNIVVLEKPPVQLDVNFSDWKREAGKSGRKDSFYDFPGGRLLRKVRTGMMFLQSQTERIAVGPCLAFESQVINFICTQYMNWLQQRAWLNCHAAALIHRSKALAIAGFSGGGKSTAMLRMLENPETQYLTNDRMLLKVEAGQVLAAGIPKQPRVNPGTIVNNSRLHSLMSKEEIEKFQSMPRAELWDHEEKFDVMINEVYGLGRIKQEAELEAFIILNWKRDSSEPFELCDIDIRKRPDLLKAIMKSPGPFYHSSSGEFNQDSVLANESDYLDCLRDVKVYEAKGEVNFDKLSECCFEIF